MIDAAQIAARYIAVWNETDQTRRLALLAEDWAEKASYVDPLMSGEGRAQIGGLIAAVHERFPGFRFRLEGRVDGYDNKVRFSWALGPEAEADMIKGTDFIVVEDGQLKSVIGFLDKVPASV